MTDSSVSLHHKINSIKDLKSVVRTMKALAASNIVQYERAVLALADYYKTVELSLFANFRQTRRLDESALSYRNKTVNAVVFGSDQGLVGQFNNTLTEFVIDALKQIPDEKNIWAVGDQMFARLTDAGLKLKGAFMVPNSVNAITPLVSQILIDTEVTRHANAHIYLFHNRPESGATYQPVMQRMLPLDETWRNALLKKSWPSQNLPEVIDSSEATLTSFICEYLFVSLFKACAESLASENASRLAAMQRADKNIDEKLDELKRLFHNLRQSGIDEELFDVISGFEALSNGSNANHPKT